MSIIYILRNDKTCFASNFVRYYRKWVWGTSLPQSFQPKPFRPDRKGFFLSYFFIFIIWEAFVRHRPADKLIAVISLTKDYENVSLIDISIGFFEDMENKDRERLDIFRRKGQTKANGWTIFERKSSKDNEGKLLGTCGLNLFSNFLPEKLTKIGTNSLMKMKSIFSHRR